MSTPFNSVNVLIKENSFEDFWNASTILINCASIIINYSNVKKYRKIRVSYPTDKAKLLTVAGGNECLNEMGFEEDEEFLTVKDGKVPQVLMQIKTVLENERVKLEFAQNSKTSSDQSSSSSQSSYVVSDADAGNPSEADVEKVDNTFIFKPTDAEIESRLMHICYSCTRDVYIRKSSSNDCLELESWSKYCHSHVNAHRKVEYDWDMVYLAREEGTDKAEVSWKFDVTGTDLKMIKLELKATSAVYENGNVSWRICSDDNCFLQTGTSLQDFMTFELQNSLTLTITALVKGGKGKVAWQHAQLFRQSIGYVENGFPFEVKLLLG